MRISILLFFFIFVFLILEVPAQTRRITPDTKLCFTVTEGTLTQGFLPNTDSDCEIVASCNQVMAMPEDTTGNIKYRNRYGGYSFAARDFSDCKWAGAEKRKSGPVTLATSNVGVFTDIRGGDVYIKKPGRRNWKRATDSDAIYPGMSIRTGRRLGVSFVYYDQTINGGRGKRTKLDLGPNTVIIIEKREDLYDEKGVVGLLQGLLRVVTEKTKGVFSIRIPGKGGTPRTSNFRVGVRGTALAIRRDPNTSTTEVFLDHGDAFLDDGIRKVTIKPRTSLKVVRGRIGQPRPMEQSVWNGLVAGTGGRMPVERIVSKKSPVTPTAGTVRKNSIGMELVYIPSSTSSKLHSGTFMMGSPKSEKKRNKDEGPQRSVKIGTGFWIGKYEVTQQEYQKVMGSNPSKFNNCGRCPVEKVSWNDTQNYIRKLNATDSDFEYRLPTEAEWEYAARAGTATVFAFGNSLGSSQANFHGRNPYGRAPKGEAKRRTAPVGSYQPNAWGLYDVHGNVWEWVEDIYNKKGYNGLPLDGSANTKVGDSSKRVCRGGAWYYRGLDLRSAARDGVSLATRNAHIGFRVVARPK